ncbi:MAG: ABC transporter ATP-binding protein [Clostridiales bacterium]|nr:ABC transporter ATP-binding protein [Clostridiales bacterium]
MKYLQTENLTKKFGSTVAVDGVNVVLEKGKIYGLLGPNGSGKSTFMKMVAGLFHPTSGNMMVQGNKLSILSKGEIAFMPTEAYFYNYMKVRTVGEFHEDFYEDFDTAKYEELIKDMNLDMNMKVSALSSGMAAKLKLAATMARDAKLFMLDEPLNGIDLIARDQIMSAIIKKASEDNIMLLSSHLIDVLENILDEVIFIKEGKIVLSGDAEEIREEKGKSIVDLYKEVFAS